MKYSRFKPDLWPTLLLIHAKGQSASTCKRLIHTDKCNYMKNRKNQSNNAAKRRSYIFYILNDLLPKNHNLDLNLLTLILVFQNHNSSLLYRVCIKSKSIKKSAGLIIPEKQILLQDTFAVISVFHNNFFFHGELLRVYK